MSVSLEPIGIVHSCFKEKFGIPRQPGLVPDARARLELLAPYNRPEAVQGLESFSHLWIVFVFHATRRDKWRPTVRPPRLGGNLRVGVFATRSNFRPNPIGLSVVELEGIDLAEGRVQLLLKGVDLLDGSPVLDIKPYLPYADAHPDASAGFASEMPAAPFTVSFSAEAEAACRERECSYPHLRAFIVQMLSNDPRPAYYGTGAARTSFGARVLDFDLRWEVVGERVTVISLDPSAPGERNAG